MCLYGFIIAYQVIQAVIKEQGLWKMRFRNDYTGEEFDATYKVVFFFLLSEYNYLVLLIIICLVMAICLLAFTAYHVYMIRGGMTTAENIKISKALGNLSYRIEKYIKTYEEKPEELTEEKYEDIKHRFEVCKNLTDKILTIYGEKNFMKHFREVMNA